MFSAQADERRPRDHDRVSARNGGFANTLGLWLSLGTGLRLGSRWRANGNFLGGRACMRMN